MKGYLESIMVDHSRKHGQYRYIIDGIGFVQRRVQVIHNIEREHLSERDAAMISLQSEKN